jgi:hypothetical protein
MSADPIQSTDGPPAVKAEVVNLREHFGDRYQIGYDPAYYAEHGEHPRFDDPWLQVICCEHGQIYPQGGERLVASTYRRGSVARRLTRLECCAIEQDGDDGVDVSFNVADFDTVAAIIRPKRRRRLSEAQQTALSEAGRNHRFRTADPGGDGKSQGQNASDAPGTAESPPEDADIK